MKDRASKSSGSIALALTLSVLIAAAGPLSQTLRLVRADPRAAEFALVFSGAWTETRATVQDAGAHEQPLQAGGPRHKPVQSSQSFQALSGYWDTASAFHAPLADVPPQPLMPAPKPAAVPVPFCIALPAAESPPAFLPSSRGPPRA